MIVSYSLTDRTVHVINSLPFIKQEQASNQMDRGFSFST